ncbi:Gfo/Idh/MocA family protein [Echinicola sp. 20G]|uniref:Gfo/Idh/MocA family protein n=1 Tax=Echinicola sp. 20G TaxID=2781961 RepID=UPI001F402F16|nr:Gfo/Idh/MocA family oxidoreductase [Echinicola sp. 20G]
MKITVFIKCFIVLLFANVMLVNPSLSQEKIKFAMVGLSHGHSPWFFEWGQQEDMELVGVFDPHEALLDKFQQRYNLKGDLLFTELEEMLLKKKPDGILVFGPIYHHLQAVELAAPLGIHVMVEKPLATTLADAEKMKALAIKHQIHLLVDYETSWYPTTEQTFRFYNQPQTEYGDIRKMVFHHGHEGPKEIGVGPEFLEWLTDPMKNGGGALVDFGCYGANIMTYLMHGESPIAVTAVTKTYKPETYPKVDDEATIIVDYQDAQGIIQASWNWPFGRKDMEVYGMKGYVITKDDKELRYRTKGNGEVVEQINQEDLGLVSNPFEYFKRVIKGELVPPPFSPYTLENNMRVMEILEAAKESAKRGEKVVLSNRDIH